MPERTTQVLQLLHDPIFAAFERERSSPSIFNAVGRTYTETWHSALLGWLCDPKGSHGLGFFPLQRLLLLLSVRDTIDPELRGLEWATLLTEGDFVEIEVKPNERETKEVTVGDMRFDVLAANLKLEPWHEVQVLIEVKVKAQINVTQNQKYIDYITHKRTHGTLILPVYLAPAYKLIGGNRTLGSPLWIGVDFQEINDEIIEPCLQHPSISKFGTYTLAEYIKTLKYPQGGKPLAITQKERNFVNALMDKHGAAIHALYEILSETQIEGHEFQPLTLTGSTTGNLKVKVGENLFEEPSVPKLYGRVLQLLHNDNYLQQIELPIASSTSRYILAREPVHQQGNPFFKPVEYQGYFMEANKSRDGALRDLEKVVRQCGLNFNVVE